MRAGPLRNVINIERSTATKSTSGERALTWSTWQTRHARIEPLSGRDVQIGKSINTTVSHKITLRNLPGVTTADRVAFGTRIFTINAALNVEELGQETHLFCTETSAAPPQS